MPRAGGRHSLPPLVGASHCRSTYFLRAPAPCPSICPSSNGCKATVAVSRCSYGENRPRSFPHRPYVSLASVAARTADRHRRGGRAHHRHAELSCSTGVLRPPNRGSWRNDMNRIFGCALAAISLLAVTVPADAKGCIKGALIGGAAGHFAGHHGALGAAAGCVIGHQEANKRNNPQPSTTGSAPRPAR